MCACVSLLYPTTTPVVHVCNGMDYTLSAAQEVPPYLLKGLGAGGGEGQQLVLVHNGMLVVC